MIAVMPGDLQTFITAAGLSVSVMAVMWVLGAVVRAVRQAAGG
jgi:hypothetical protein